MKQLAKISALLTFAAALSAPALAAPETYAIDGSHTFPRFSYDHMGLSTQLSKFSRTSGTIVLDKAARTAQVDVTIDMKSVQTGFAPFNDHIQGPDFLDTARFPTATYKSTRVVFDGDKPTAIEGQLTIKGVTRPVTLKVTRFVSVEHPMLKKPALGADATAVIRRSEFNAGAYAPAVGDEVTLSIAVEAVKAN